VTASGAHNPDYDIDFGVGTASITPAPLTITPADVVVASGEVPTYAWHGDGWVNGDSDATFSLPGRTPPTCAAVVGAPGEYAGAVTCSGAHDTNYQIVYGTADLRVDPVISLDQRGLPTTVEPKAFLDGAPVVLPVVGYDVPLGSHHSLPFPAVVIDGAGQTFVTTEAPFDANVTTNIDVTARYLMMRQLLRRAERSGGIKPAEAELLAHRWQGIHVLIGQHRNGKAKDALHRFADRVRRQTGVRIRQATAKELIDYTRAVYERIGGQGPG
jgi:hypothetical protein